MRPGSRSPDLPPPLEDLGQHPGEPGGTARVPRQVADRGEVHAPPRGDGGDELPERRGAEVLGLDGRDAERRLGVVPQVPLADGVEDVLLAMTQTILAASTVAWLFSMPMVFLVVPRPVAFMLAALTVAVVEARRAHGRSGRGLDAGLDRSLAETLILVLIAPPTAGAPVLAPRRQRPVGDPVGPHQVPEVVAAPRPTEGLLLPCWFLLARLRHQRPAVATARCSKTSPT
eukprot:CAMPEP_0206226672 /NCGR_PEP_ID=MMETSP0047_2-20121206/8220_1 /ASSEMBLY_ACC=CAM_ASM_000192 /TAXON_ID=195065 /ORGANISM="Chroomonas mesostigmatica_cf, Strain CCMP1168" /LENGTH=229 /DNA_ID=CAMNT_0053649783 /DNA_START=534 /DNA_END=1222 /DNA_ORIENTATION=-